MSLRTKAEIALVVILLGAGAAWLSRTALSQTKTSGASSLHGFEQSRMYSLLAKTKALEEKRDELAAKIKVVKGEVEALDLTIQQSLHNSQVKVTDVLAAFEKDSRP